MSKWPIVVVLSLGACGVGGVPSAAADTSTPVPARTKASCNVMPLIAHKDHRGRLIRLYVRVERDGVPGLLMFDTGTSTHVVGKRPQTIRMFCEDRVLEGWPGSPVDDGVQDGLPVFGLLGRDVLDAGAVEVDTQKGTFTVHPSGPVRGTESWTRVPLTYQGHHAETHAVIDGKTFKMAFDTGIAHTLFVDPSADMSPPTYRTAGSDGIPIVMKSSKGVLVLGDGAAPRTIVVERTRRFPIEERAKAKYGFDGCLGLSTLSDHFVWDKQRLELRLAPVP